MRRLFPALVTSLSFALACGFLGGDDATEPETDGTEATDGTTAEVESAMAERVTIRDTRARAMPPGSPASAAFLTLRSAGKPAALVGATTDAAQTVELHAHIDNNGVMEMRQVDRIELPTDVDVELKPGGLHLMLLGLTKDLVVGEELVVTLQFEDKTEKQLSVPVADIEVPTSKSKAGHHSPEMKDKVDELRERREERAKARGKSKGDRGKAKSKGE